VREENNRLRVSVRVVNADGFHILSERFETESDTQGVFKFSEKIVSESMSRVGREQSRFKKPQLTLSLSMATINSALNPAETSENLLYP